MLRLKELYQKEVVKNLKEKFDYKNIYSIPKIIKVVVNVGIGKNRSDQKYIDTVTETLTNITGQKPALRVARKAISGFKLRKGDASGKIVTLRGKRMYDFLEKLIRIVLPRTRDFRGIKLSSIDQRGNLNMGIKEQTVFTEIKQEKVEKTHSLEISIVTTCNNKEESKELFSLLGLPFQK